MRVKAIRNYFDKNLMRVVETGEVIEVTGDRANVLCSTNNESSMIMCERVADPEPKPVAKPKGKGGRPKKEAK